MIVVTLAPMLSQRGCSPQAEARFLEVRKYTFTEPGSKVSTWSAPEAGAGDWQLRGLGAIVNVEQAWDEVQVSAVLVDGNVNTMAPLSLRRATKLLPLMDLPPVLSYVNAGKGGFGISLRWVRP